MEKRYPNCTQHRYRFNLGHYDANHGWNEVVKRTSKRIANSIIMLTAKQPIWIKSKAWLLVRTIMSPSQQQNNRYG